MVSCSMVWCGMILVFNCICTVSHQFYHRQYASITTLTNAVPWTCWPFVIGKFYCRSDGRLWLKAHFAASRCWLKWALTSNDITNQHYQTHDPLLSVHYLLLYRGQTQTVDKSYSWKWSLHRPRPTHTAWSHCKWRRSIVNRRDRATLRVISGCQRADRKWEAGW